MSFAMKYAMKKRMAKGCPDCESGKCMAHGGAVVSTTGMDGDDGEDMVARVMRKRYSEGGMVANDTDMSADLEPNEFDLLVKSGGLEGEYAGSNEMGDESVNDEGRDIVARVMRSRAKKDRNPRPA